MTSNDLKSQLAGLFSDTVPEPEGRADTAELRLEKAIGDLLGGEAEVEPAAITPMAVEVPPSVVTGPEQAREQRSIPPASADLGGVTLIPIARTKAASGGASTEGIENATFPEAIGMRVQRTRTLSVLLHGVTILGGVLLILLLVRLVWQEPMAWSGFRALYFAAYTVAVAIMLIQSIFNSSLSRALREAERSRARAVRSQSRLKERADELATANAVLHKRTLQLQTAAQISQTAASWLDLDELVQRSVKLVRERFDLYYVGLFLVDENSADAGKQWAVLRAGTGEAGRRMRAQGYRLEVGDTSKVGWCIAHAQTYSGPDLGARSRRSPAKASSLLPGARSEIALPLRSRGRAIGALDVQSTSHQAFSQEDIAVLQMVADQLAVAIDNARLFSEIQAKLDDMEARPQRATREQRTDSMPTQAAPSYGRIRPSVTSLDRTTAPEGLGELGGSNFDGLGRAVEQAMTHHETFVQSGVDDGTGRAAMVVPLSLRGEVIGALGLHETEGCRRWTDDEIALVEAVADQMVLAIENARLLEETQQRAKRDRLIADITAQVRSSRDPETILRTAVRQLGAALGTDRALVQLRTGAKPSDEQS
jgi:GAF domain-containing protein